MGISKHINTEHGTSPIKYDLNTIRSKRSRTTCRYAGKSGWLVDDGGGLRKKKVRERGKEPETKFWPLPESTATSSMRTICYSSNQAYAFVFFQKCQVADLGGAFKVISQRKLHIHKLETGI